jgi:peptidoglycan hydrolase-like protein with peptidoglycan-binding domain
MNLRTIPSLLFTASVLTAGIAMADDPSGAAATSGSAATAKPAAATHTSTMHHHKLSKDEVIAVQNALSKSGEYKGKIDGSLGKGTQEALRSYQKANSLKVTGWPDTATLDKLGVPHTATMAAAPAGNSSSTAKK